MNRSIVAGLLILAALPLFSHSAQADDMSDALKAFENAKVLFHELKYKEAADSFREAYKLKPNWKLLYNIGQSEAAGKRHGLALQAFESYLSQGGDDIEESRLAAVDRKSVV